MSIALYIALGIALAPFISFAIWFLVIIGAAILAAIADLIGG